MLRKDGIPESINFSNLRVDYDVDELRDIFSVRDDSNLVGNNQDQMLSANSVDQLIGKKKRVDEFKLDSSPNLSSLIRLSTSGRRRVIRFLSHKISSE